MTDDDDNNNDDKTSGAAAQSAQDLASQLLAERFQGDEIATARYLLNAINSLPNATETKRIVLHGSGGDASNNDDTAEAPTAASPDSIDIGDILVEKVAVSCTQPRGKLDMTVGSSAILFSKDNATLFTVQGAVSHCIFFPKPSDCRKRYKIGAKLPPEMVLLVLNEEVTFKKKSFSQLCFQLPATTTPDASTNHTTTWSERFQSILAIGTIERVLLRDNPVFRAYQDNRSSSTTAGLPFIDCYHNVTDGCLYLLQAGIFFFGSGMRFVPRSTLHSIEAVALNRYATLSVTLDKTDVDDDDNNDDDDDDDEEQDDDNRPTAGDQLEFTNIHKDEKDGIQKYIHRTLIPAMKQDAEEDDNTEDQQGRTRIAATGDGDDEDDGASSPRRKRKAASEAGTINKRTTVSGNKSRDDDDDDDDDDEDAADQSYDEEDEGSDVETEDEDGSDGEDEDF